MLPYFGLTTIQIGPIPIQVWGSFVAAGILVGLWVSMRRAETLGLKKAIVADLAVWIIAAAFLGARLTHVFFYDIGTYFADPLEFFRVWNGGLSITGGFVASLLVTVWYLKHKHVDVWSYMDATIYGLPVGLGIGRIGCFLIHDHPGTLSDFVLAVEYPDGEGRLDHGLFLSINGFLMAIVFALMARKKQPVGMFLAVFGAWYGVVRFGLDFWRAVDKTYLGLTPAQYFSLFLFFAGVWGIFKLRGKIPELGVDNASSSTP